MTKESPEVDVLKGKINPPKLILTLDTTKMDVSTSCALCGKAMYVKQEAWDFDKNLCCERHELLWKDYHERGWPEISNEEWYFWSELFGKLRIKREERIKRMIEKKKEGWF